MGKIKLLDHNLINLIAAGEVVERPASVLKELLENSVDAGSTTIKVQIEDGGLKLISVSDDGEGMTAEDAHMAFTQHATSKLHDAKDLENILTLGFRGEALASIRAVSSISIETKTEADPAVKLDISATDIHESSSAKSTKGTTIKVIDLFAQIPARRKFLRTANTEFGHLENIFVSIALVHLGVHFELYHNNKLVYRLPATTEFKQRIHAIWGEKVATNLYTSEVEQNGVVLHMFLGSPDIARKDRTQQYLFVNHRHISDRVLQRAMNESYLGFIHRDLQPVYFVFLDIPPSEVDVNVHPRKQEVRFHNGSQIFQLVHHAARGILEKSTKDSLTERVRQAENSVAEPAPASSWQPSSTSFSKPSFSAPKFGNPVNHKQNVSQSLSFTKALLSSEQNSDTKLTEPEPTTFNEELMSFVGLTQFFNTYIVYEQGDNIVFIDQHAAAEKILYEKLLAQANLSASRQLLIPAVVELKPKEKESLLKLEKYLGSIGIKFADFGGDSIQITHLPELIPELEISSFLQEALSQAGELEDNTSLMNIDGSLATEEIQHSLNLEHPAHHLIATLACHGAIRAGQKLTFAEMKQLAEDLEKCTHPYNCPHGRPVSWVLSRREVEQAFKRII